MISPTAGIVEFNLSWMASVFKITTFFWFFVDVFCVEGFLYFSFFILVPSWAGIWVLLFNSSFGEKMLCYITFLPTCCCVCSVCCWCQSRWCSLWLQISPVSCLYFSTHSNLSIVLIIWMRHTNGIKWIASVASISFFLSLIDDLVLILDDRLLYTSLSSLIISSISFYGPLSFGC